MDKHLSPETEVALKKLAREIGETQDFGADAQDELYAHLEDKTLAYLSGDEALSEADAVLLARKHLGVSRPLLGVGKPSAVPVRSATFARTIAAIAVVDLSLEVVFSSLLGIIGVVLLLHDRPRVLSDIPLLMCLATPCIIGLVVARYLSWKQLRAVGEERSPWYLRWKPRTIAILLCALLVIRWVLPGRIDLLSPSILSPDRLPRGGVEWLIVALPVLWVLIWFQWIGKSNRSFASLATGGAAWFMLRLSYGVPEKLLGHASLYRNADGDLAWVSIPGRLLREPNDVLSMSKSILRILWENGSVPLAFIVLTTVLYILQHHLVRAIRMYVQSFGNEQRGMPWMTD